MAVAPLPTPSPEPHQEVEPPPLPLAWVDKLAVLPEQSQQEVRAVPHAVPQMCTTQALPTELLPTRMEMCTKASS